MLGITSTILASTLTLPLLATHANNAYAENTANTDTTLKISDDIQLSVTAPTRINYKLEPDGSFICPTDAEIKNNSSIPIATKSWTASINTGTAVSTDDFAGSSASNAWWNTVSADNGESSFFNLDTETLYDSWNMAASGQSLNETQDDTLSLSFDGEMKNIDGSIDYNTGKQLTTVTFTFGTVLNGKIEPKPAPESGIMFAVYSEDDNSLNFYKRDRVPEVGEVFNGKNITKIYENIKNENIEKTDSTLSLPPWYEIRERIESVTFVDDGCSPHSLAYWFYRMINLKKIDSVKLNTSNVISLIYTFCDCESLTELNLGKWDTFNVTSLESTFSNCKSLTNLTPLSYWDTSNMRHLGCTFLGCKSLTNFNDLANWNTSNVDYLRSTFMNCESLENLDFLSKWDTSNITTFSQTFWGCKKITDLSAIAFWDTSNAESLSYMFCDCISIAKLDLSHWNVSKVADFDSTFKNCKSLMDLSSIASWNTSCATSMCDTFSNVPLKFIDVSGWTISDDLYVNSLFGSHYELKWICVGSKSWRVATACKNSVYSEDGMLYALSGGCYYSYEIPVGISDTYYVTKALRDEAAYFF